MRDTYYGGATLSNLGNFLDPWVGSMVLEAFGGTVMFLMYGLIALIGILFYRRGQLVYHTWFITRKRRSGNRRWKTI
jgi:hypothetical protein